MGFFVCGPVMATTPRMAAKRSTVKTETQISSGGAAFRKAPGGLEVALISVGQPPRWQLPKGLIDKGESAEQAAVREVREEAGIEARIDTLIEKVEYWYQSTRGAERVRYHKFVYFFFMWYESGDVADHDHEVNEAKWVHVTEAISLLAFRSERRIVERAIQIAE
jgi:8-oxo-dGTP pyrophosphatase MutT (NUDIX family)